MSVADGCSDGRKEIFHLAMKGEFLLVRCLTNVVGEGRPFDVVHHDVGLGLLGFQGGGDMEAMHTHNVRMAQGGDQFRLAYARQVLVTCHEIRIIYKISVEYLDSDVALQLRVEGLPDLGHAATSHARLQL